MARLGRPGMTDAQKDEIWRRWRTGGSLSDISRAVGKFPASILGLLRLHGGVTPPVRQRAVRALTLAEREEISRASRPALLCVRLPGSFIVRLRLSVGRSRGTPIGRVIVRSGRLRPRGNGHVVRTLSTRA
jgi:hypothetical protein